DPVTLGKIGFVKLSPNSVFRDQPPFFHHVLGSLFMYSGIYLVHGGAQNSNCWKVKMQSGPMCFYVYAIGQSTDDGWPIRTEVFDYFSGNTFPIVRGITCADDPNGPFGIQVYVALGKNKHRGIGKRF